MDGMGYLEDHPCQVSDEKPMVIVYPLRIGQRSPLQMAELHGL